MGEDDLRYIASKAGWCAAKTKHKSPDEWEDVDIMGGRTSMRSSGVCCN